MIKYIATLLLTVFAFSAQAGIIKTVRPGYTATFTETTALIQVDQMKYTGRCDFNTEYDGIDDDNNTYHVYFFTCPGGYDLMLKNYISLHSDGIKFYRRRDSKLFIDDMFLKDEMFAVN